jgi:branched-chain amino acid transport system ATP-binding protein
VLLRGERGDDQGEVQFKGERDSTSSHLMNWSAACHKMMEERHCFSLTIEENLMTRAYTRTDSRATIRRSLEAVTSIFRLKSGAAIGGATGGEQQMCAIRARADGRRPILPDEPSWASHHQIVEEIFDIVKT